MADSLDDFFAKKDKKRKNKNQTAAFSAEALVRELEEGSKQSEYSARREGKASAAMEILGLDTNDNDWKDFEEVEKRDYTGLKVKEMSIQDQDEEQRRLTEQSEQVPETIPWKSKQETVAAIISAKDDINQLSSDPIEQTNATTTNTSTTTTTTSSSDNTISDASKAVTSSTPDERLEGVKEGVDNSSQVGEKKLASQEGTLNEEAPKKDGDNKQVSAKKAYVPPQERLDKEYKVLEPTRLSKLKSSSSRPGATINIKDETMFPSLG